jgi:hypothetical protein
MVYNVHRMPYPSKRFNRYVRDIRVFLNGQDVSRRCFYADPRRGVVRLYWINRDSSGAVIAYVLDTAGKKLATQEVRGRVVVRRTT